MEPPRLLGSLRLSTGCCQDLTCVSRSKVCDSDPLAYGDGSPPRYGHGFELPNSLIPSPRGPPAVQTTWLTCAERVPEPQICGCCGGMSFVETQGESWSLAPSRQGALRPVLGERGAEPVANKHAIWLDYS